MRRTALIPLLSLLVLCPLPLVPPVRAATATYTQSATSTTRPHTASAASPSCSGDPLIGSTVSTLAISGILAVLGDGQALTILDIGNPARPICRSHLIQPFVVTSVQVQGERAYLALETDTNMGGLRIVDIHDPDNPTIIGSYNVKGARYLAVNGNFLYLFDNNGLDIFDVSDPARPVLENTFDHGGVLQIIGNRMYLQSGFAFEILDLTDPIHPNKLGGFYEGTINFYGFSVSGNRAYLIRPSRGVEVLDISNPANPILIGTYTNIPDGDTQIRGIQVIGNTLYIAGARFEIYDVSSPTKAALIGSYDPPGVAFDLRLGGSLAYIATSGNSGEVGPYGFEIIDLSNLANPFLRGWFRNGNTGRFFYMQPILR